MNNVDDTASTASTETSSDSGNNDDNHGVIMIVDEYVPPTTITTPVLTAVTLTFTLKLDCTTICVVPLVVASLIALIQGYEANRIWVYILVSTIKNLYALVRRDDALLIAALSCGFGVWGVAIANACRGNSPTVIYILNIFMNMCLWVSNVPQFIQSLQNDS